MDDNVLRKRIAFGALRAARFGTQDGQSPEPPADASAVSSEVTPDKVEAEGTVSVSNHDFLAALFNGMVPEEYLWACEFIQNPKPGKWTGHNVFGTLTDYPACNTYFSVSALKPDASGARARRKENFSRQFAVVLDDSPPLPGIEATWVLETSHPEGRSNTQVGYRLAEPLADAGIANRLQKALGDAGHLPIDNSGNNIVRYVRLPVGSNTKYSPSHPCRLLAWNPDGRVTLPELIGALGFDRDAILNEPAPPPKQEQEPMRAHGRSEGGFFHSVKDAALANMACWVPSIFPSAKPYQGGYRVSSKALGRNLEEDLSLLPAGIQDFGEEHGLTAIDVVMKWGTPARTVSEAALWLCSQMGIDPVTLGWNEPLPRIDASGILGQSSGKSGQAGTGEADTKLIQGEAEQLIAWSWKTGTALPDAREQFEGEINPRTGKPFPRLRVSIGIGDNSNPCCEIGWKSRNAEDFIRRSDEQIDNRFNRDSGDKESAGPDDFKRHARQWVAQIAALSVGDETAQALLQRITPPWPEPQPIPSALLPVASFDSDLLPVSLRGWIADVATRMQCPPDFPAVGGMVTLSSVIGRKAVIQPKQYDDWTVTPNLWGGVVGRPGIMKSPALAAALAPLDRLQVAATKEYLAAKKDHARDEKLRAMQAKSDEAKAQKLIASGKRKDAEDLLIEAEEEADNADADPTLRRYKVNDSSVEALGEILIENPWGTLAYRDELHGLLASMDKEGQEGARSFYLQGYDGNQGYTFDRIVRGRHLHIPAVCLAMLGGIQPGKLKSYIRAATEGGTGDDGLLQRFSLLVWPDVSGDWVNVDRWPDTAAKNTAFATFERLDGISPATDAETGDPAPRVYRFTPEAQSLFNEWRSDFEKRLRSEDMHPAMESHLAKYRKLVPAIALICALADDEEQVSEGSLLRSLAWADYLETHAARMYAAGTGMDMEGATALLAKIRSGAVKDGFKPADVYLKGWASLATPKDVGAAARVLCDLGHIKRIETKPEGAGRPSVTYQINPLTNPVTATKC